VYTGVYILIYASIHISCAGSPRRRSHHRLRSRGFMIKLNKYINTYIRTHINIYKYMLYTYLSVYLYNSRGERPSQQPPSPAGLRVNPNTHIYICIYIYTHPYICMCIQVYTYLSIYLSMHLFMSAARGAPVAAATIACGEGAKRLMINYAKLSLSLYIYIYMYTHIYLSIYTQTYIGVYMYIYT